MVMEDRNLMYTMVADGMVSQGARISVAMVLT